MKQSVQHSVNRAVLGAALAATATFSPAAGLCSTVSAQEPGRIPRSAALGEGAFRAPIHTATDDCDAAESAAVATTPRARYGIWAAGDDYKVSFHDGFSFVPVLGDAFPHNLPLGWRTESVRLGNVDMLDAGGTAAGSPYTTRSGHRVSDWRYEYRIGAVTEAYDVRSDGVEQTFVIQQTAGPLGDGDLVVEGRFDTTLRAAVQSTGAHASLVFSDPVSGLDVVEYGAATAVDAEGRKAEMTTTYDGDVVTLRAPASWLRTATFPITVDPVIRTVIASVSGGAVGTTSTAFSASPREHMVTYSRTVSATDQDLYVRTMPGQWSTPSTVYTDITASWSTEDSDSAHVKAPGRWVVSFLRRFATGQVLVRCHFRDVGNTMATTTTRTVTSTAGEQNFRAVVSGNESYTGNEALFVYEVDRTTGASDTRYTELWARVFDASAITFGTPIRIGPQIAASGEAERPAIDAYTTGTHWNVAFQCRSQLTSAPWVIGCCRVQPDGQRTNYFRVSPIPTSVESVAPKICGTLGPVAITWIEHRNSRFGEPVGPTLRCRIIDWEHGGTQSMRPPQVLRTGTSLRNADLAIDSRTRSHWTAITTEGAQSGAVQFDRFGADGRVAEAGLVAGGSSGTPSIVWNWMESIYQVVHATGSTLLGTDIGYGPATHRTYGAPCGNGGLSISSAHSSLPHAGHERYSIGVTGVPSGMSVFAFVGLAPMQLDLQAIGMPGCTFLLDPTQIVAALSFDMTTNARIQLPIPSTAVGVDLYVQAAYVAPAANALSLETTNAVEAHVR